jgi:hypothetical protein
VREAWEVAVVALVDGLQAKQVCRRAGRSRRALRLPGEGGGVVRERVYRALTAVNVVNKDVMLGNGASQLKVRVRDSAGGVVAADEIPLNIKRKRRTPEQGVDAVRAGGDKDHTAHARAGGIGSANRARVGVDNLAEPGGAGVKVADQPPDIVKEIMHVRGEPDAFAVVVAEGLLEQAEEAPETGDGKHHAAQFTKDLLPALGGDAGLAARKLGKEGHEAEKAVRRKL